MSQENVETVVRLIDAYNRRDVETMLQDLDPAAEWRPALPLILGEATVYHGHEGAREWLRNLYDVVDEAEVEYSEIRDLGDRVLGIGHMRIRGRGSGAETDSPFAHLTDFSPDGKAIRMWTYLDPDEALDAAGLSE
jgi:ketosteroid isomerase-like protein